jgi:hypothetical protein
MRFLFRAPSPARRSLPLSGGLVLGLLLQVCAHAADLRVGFMPGPYRDAFTHGIEPQLKKLPLDAAQAPRSLADSDIAAYQSPEFQRFFKANPTWAGYRLPDCFSQ